MSELQAAIAYFEDAVRESDEIIADCSPALQAELAEQKGHFVVALEIMRRARPNNEPLPLIDAIRETDEYISLIFTHGGCWRFHKLLKSIFPEAEPYKVMGEPSIRINRYDHIITKIGNLFYDITGEVSPTDFIDCAPVESDNIPMFERWSFAGNHLLAMPCPNCGEDIAMDAAGQVDRPDAIPDNAPLTLEELRGMDGTQVWVQYSEIGMAALVAYHSDDDDGDDGDNVYLTNNLGGRSTFEEVMEQGGIAYRRKPVLIHGRAGE